MNISFGNTDYPIYFTVGALPPEHQMAREIEAIRNDPRLQELLNGNAIVSIKKIARLTDGTQQYIVTLDNGDIVRVNVSYVIPKTVSGYVCGPAKFELDFLGRETP